MSRSAVAFLSAEADLVVPSGSPRDFRGVGYWYADFTQVADDDVLRSLDAAATWRRNVE
jgi:putative phosphoribosyl transferase